MSHANESVDATVTRSSDVYVAYDPANHLWEIATEKFFGECNLNRIKDCV